MYVKIANWLKRLSSFILIYVLILSLRKIFILWEEALVAFFPLFWDLLVGGIPTPHMMEMGEGSGQNWGSPAEGGQPNINPAQEVPDEEGQQRLLEEKREELRLRIRSHVCHYRERNLDKWQTCYNSDEEELLHGADAEAILNDLEANSVGTCDEILRDTSGPNIKRLYPLFSRGENHIRDIR